MPDCALTQDGSGFGPGGRARAGFSILLINEGTTCELDTRDLTSELVGADELDVEYALDDKPRLVTLETGEFLGLEYWWRNWCGPEEVVSVRVRYRDSIDELIDVRQRPPSCTDDRRSSTLSLWLADRSDVIDSS